jgi:hypothetical protein
MRSRFLISLISDRREIRTHNNSDRVKTKIRCTVQFAKLYLMNEKLMNTISKTNWEKVDSLTEAEIDTSDIPPLTEEFFSRSRWWKPVAPLNALVQIVRSPICRLGWRRETQHFFFHLICWVAFLNPTYRIFGKFECDHGFVNDKERSPRNQDS